MTTPRLQTSWVALLFLASFSNPVSALDRGTCERMGALLKAHEAAIGHHLFNYPDRLDAIEEIQVELPHDPDRGRYNARVVVEKVEYRVVLQRGQTCDVRSIEVKSDLNRTAEEKCAYSDAFAKANDAGMFLDLLNYPDQTDWRAPSSQIVSSMGDQLYTVTNITGTTIREARKYRSILDSARGCYLIQSAVSDD